MGKISLEKEKEIVSEWHHFNARIEMMHEEMVSELAFRLNLTESTARKVLDKWV